MVRLGLLLATGAVAHYDRFCDDGEVEIHPEEGGRVCAAPCETDDDCPLTDIPPGAKLALPGCVVKHEGTTYCGLRCGDLEDGDCPTNAECTAPYSGFCRWLPNPRFDCPNVTGVPLEPKDVTELHPSQVSLVMVVGDSISAAFSAHSNLNEARQVSFDGGIGANDQLTLPYLISQYSPRLEGQSTKARLPKDILHLPDGDYNPKTDHLNFAESQGAAHLGSVDQQWAYLMERKDDYEDFDSRWKVLTYWMFANDVCGMCDEPATESHTFKTWVKRTDEFLTNVTERLSNVYVNLVSMLDLSHIHRIQQSKGGCKIEHELILQECGCIDRGNETELAQLDSNVQWMNARFHQFSADWQAKLQAQGRKDIAIVTQSSFEGLGPDLDNSFLSKLDCFHPSAKAHQDLAIGLWNSMLCVDDREHKCGWGIDASATCPTRTSYFYTGPDVAPKKSHAIAV